MNLENRFQNIRSNFDDIQKPQKVSETVLSFLISLNKELLERKHNDVSLL